MLERIRQLMKEGVDFALETTLATRSYVGLIQEAKKLGYTISITFFWLESPELAINRVAARVARGGHNIPTAVIRRRYTLGIKYFLASYRDLADYAALFDNTDVEPQLIAEFTPNSKAVIFDEVKFRNFVQHGNP